jgi:hypothetical protein
MPFSITADLTKDSLWDASRGAYPNPPPGLYEVTTKSADEHKATIKFVVSAPGVGEFEIFVPKDMTKESNRRKMKTAIVSHGAKAEVLDKTPNLTISEKLFVGRKAIVLVTKVEGQDEQGREKLNDRDFVTAEQAKQIRAQGGAAAPKKEKKADPAPEANGAAPAGDAAGSSPMDDLFGGAS